MSVLRDYAATVSQPTLPLSPSAESVRYDEFVDADGSLRPAWKALAAHALSLTGEDLQRVDGEIARFLADDGVSYLRGDSGPQPWQLDPVPFVFDAAGWSPLEVGLAQRAELLNALLVDLYGPQNLMREGIVPSAVVFGHSGFTRPLARASAVDPHPLLLAATDLGRDAEGEWHVLADRVQAPSGLGFAAENRRVISQVLPDLFQEENLHRIDPYFSALRAALLSSVATESDDPRVVILHSRNAERNGIRPGIPGERARFPPRAGQRPRRPRRVRLDETRRLAPHPPHRPHRRHHPESGCRVVRPPGAARRTRGWAWPDSAKPYAAVMYAW